MPAFINLRTKEITITRLGRVSGNRLAFTCTVTSDYVNIQQASARKSLEVTGAVGKLYHMFTDIGLDILDGDRVRDEDGREYDVVAGGLNANCDFGTMVQHKEVLMLRITYD